MGARKRRYRALSFYFGLSERKILHEMNRKSKYDKFNSKLRNKVIPRSLKVKNVMSQNQIKLISMKSQAVAYKKKTYLFNRFCCLALLQRKLLSQVPSKLDRIFVKHGFPETFQSGNIGEFKKQVYTLSLHSCDYLKHISIKRIVLLYT